MKALHDIFRRKLKRFLKAEDGTATIEFVLVFPAFMILFVSAFELGLLQVRHTMLERGLDVTVREIRLSTAAPPSYVNLKKAVCNNAMIIPDCLANLKIEMVRVDPRAGVSVTRVPDCVDRAQPLAPVRAYNTGNDNELMLLRVCALFDPIFPLTGLGFQIPKQSGGAYALVSMSSYVSEPG